METYLYILCVYPLLYMGDILLITYGDILLNHIINVVLNGGTNIIDVSD